MPANCDMCSRFPAFMSYHLCCGDLWWCSCWVISAPVQNPYNLQAIPIQLIVHHVRLLFGFVSVLRSVTGSLSGVSTFVHFTSNSSFCKWKGSCFSSWLASVTPLVINSHRRVKSRQLSPCRLLDNNHIRLLFWNHKKHWKAGLEVKQEAQKRKTI